MSGKKSKKTKLSAIKDKTEVINLVMGIIVLSEWASEANCVDNINRRMNVRDRKFVIANMVGHCFLHNCES